MTSLEQTRQSLRSLNLAAIILNAIWAGLSFLGFLFILLGMSFLGQANLAENGAAAADIQPLIGLFGGFGIIMTLLATIAPLIIAVLAFQNRKNIEQNQPSLWPYYIGAAFTVLDLVGGVGRLQFTSLLINLGMLALYYFAIQKAKQLLDSNSTDQIIS